MLNKEKITCNTNSTFEEYQIDQSCVELDTISTKPNVIPEWQIDEAERRLYKYKSGQAKGVDAFEALERIKKSLIP